MPPRPRRRSVRAPLATVGLVAMLAAACGPPSMGEGPGAPTTFREQLVIPTGDLELAATLHLPAAEPPFPAIALIHGSGPLPRQGPVVGQLGLTFPSAIPIYEQLAVGLAERGYAVLVWDKRTCGPFNGCGSNDYPVPPDDLTVDAFREDAAAALDVLADLAEITEVVVLGHSQGGTFAAQLAVDHPAVDAAVLLTTPEVTIDRVLDAQADKLAELGGDADWNVATALVEPWQDRLPADGELEILLDLTHALTRLDEQDLTRMQPEDVGLEVDERVPTRIAAWLDAVLGRTS
jgi:pimeloyl-ACP methyl ester carboxylesterase